uniref:Uncharacterized protein n=2 Tax=Anguilla anguilla TaxID=7936 RepID=A0A0E9UX33_ANGAN
MSLDLPQTEGAAGSWSLLRYGVYILGPSLFWVHVQMKCFLLFFKSVQFVQEPISLPMTGIWELFIFLGLKPYQANWRDGKLL